MTVSTFPEDPVVHAVAWAGQPDIRLFCTTSNGESYFTTPAWGVNTTKHPKLPPGVFWGEPVDLLHMHLYVAYTFGWDKVTCPHCLKARSSP